MMVLMALLLMGMELRSAGLGEVPVMVDTYQEAVALKLGADVIRVDASALEREGHIRTANGDCDCPGPFGASDVIPVAVSSGRRPAQSTESRWEQFKEQYRIGGCCDEPEVEMERMGWLDCLYYN